MFIYFQIKLLNYLKIILELQIVKLIRKGYINLPFILIFQP